MGWLVLLWFFARALAHFLGIPDDAPVKQQPFGLVWLVLFMAAAWAFFLVALRLSLLLETSIRELAFRDAWSVARTTGLRRKFHLSGLAGVKKRSSVPERLDQAEDPMYDPQLDDRLWP
jgi:hypothetical protein